MRCRRSPPTSTCCRNRWVHFSSLLVSSSLLTDTTWSIQIRELRNAAGRKDAIIRRAATIFEDYRIARQQAYFSSEKRTIPTHGGGGGGGGGGGSSAINGTGSAMAAASIQEFDEHGQLVKERTVNGTMARALKKDLPRQKVPVVAEPSTGVVEIIAQNEEMKSAFKRLSDMLSPYLKEDHADVRILP